jgi:transcriptional regulator with XRE-family HTH domain
VNFTTCTQLTGLLLLRQHISWWYFTHMMTPTQCAMARAGLRWSSRDLAERAVVGVNTVSRFETGFKAEALTVKRLRVALEAAGAVFLEDDGAGPGVRVKPRDGS